MNEVLHSFVVLCVSFALLEKKASGVCAILFDGRFANLINSQQNDPSLCFEAELFVQEEIEFYNRLLTRIFNITQAENAWDLTNLQHRVFQRITKLLLQ